MWLLLMLLIPVAQIYLIRKRLAGKINISILGISMLMVFATIPIGIITIILCEYSIGLENRRLMCDPTIPGVISIALLIALFITPAIGLVARIARSETESLPPLKNEQYSFKKSYQENIK